MKYFEDIYISDKSLIHYFYKYSKMIGKKIKAKKDNEYIEAIVIGVTEEGYLKVEVNDKIDIWISRASLDIDTSY